MKTKFYKKLTFVAVMAIFNLSPLFAVNYYVDVVNGKDSNTGLSETIALASIQAIIMIVLIFKPIIRLRRQRVSSRVKGKQRCESNHLLQIDYRIVMRAKHTLVACLLSMMVSAQTKPYGSGNFGKWITDGCGLPAYDFTQGSKDSMQHLLGNSYCNVVAHGGGYIELYSTRYFPKAVNNLKKSENAYSGGFGWVKDGKTTWSTLYDNRPSGAISKMVYGMGYVEKTITFNELKVDQKVFVPTGNDEVILEEITFYNEGNTEKNITYTDYWDVAMVFLNPQRPYYTDKVKTYYDKTRSSIKAVMEGSQGDFSKPSSTDPAKLAIFASVLNNPVSSFDTKQDAFFGSGNIAKPDGVSKDQLSNSIDANGLLPNQDAVLATQTKISIGAKKSKTIYVLYGVTLKGTENKVIDTYRKNYASKFEEVITENKNVRLDFPSGNEWIAREMAWSNYYLMSGMLREEYFGTSCINQSGLYLYHEGRNIAFRDPLQHLMPLSYTKPEYAKATLRYVLRTMLNNGKLERGTIEYGQVVALDYDASDQELFLFWSLCDYIFATRDWAFLDETVNFWNGGSATVYEALKRSFEYVVKTAGKGEHDVIRVKKADWADNFLDAAGNEHGTIKRGESTQDQAMAALTYPMLKSLARYKKDESFAGNLHAETQKIITTLNSTCWKKEFYNRGWVIDKQNNVIEVGSAYPHIESNAYALLADSLMTEQMVSSLVSRIQTDNAYPESGMIVANPNSKPTYGECKGIWFAPGHAMIQGLAKHAYSNQSAKKLVWQEFTEMTLGHHAEQWPDVFYGIISAPDYWNPKNGRVGNYTRPWPQLLMHIHSQALLSSVRFAGVWPNSQGYLIEPAFPFDTFSWESERLKVKYGKNSVSGFVKTVGDDLVKMKVKLPSALKNALVSINGKSVSCKVDDGYILFDMVVKSQVITEYEVTGL
jgi:hypothetical protein